MLLAGGAAEAVLFLALTALLPLWLTDYRSPAARRALAWGAGGALLFGAAWLGFLASQHIPLKHIMNLQRWLDGAGEYQRPPQRQGEARHAGEDE